MEPATSVVIPCYNGEDYLPEALESVRLQTIPVREIIVVDDGSRIPVRAPAGWEGPPLRIVRTPNRGQAAARNLGISLATGSYIAFLDADDLWLPAKIERQEAALAANPNAVACYVRCTNEPGFYAFGPYPPPAVSEEEFLLIYWYLQFFPPSATVVRSDVLRAAGGFQENLGDSGEDHELMMRVLARGPFVQVPEPLCRYRQHGQQFTQKISLVKRMRGGKKVRGVMIRLHADRLIRAGLDKRRLWDAYRDAVLMVYYRREFAAARRLLWDYWRDHPLDLQILKYALISLLPPRWVGWFRGELVSPGEGGGGAPAAGGHSRSWHLELGRVRQVHSCRRIPTGAVRSEVLTPSQTEGAAP
jgi:glycosyltransferase involved in cell wall biosynthesis